MAVVKYNDSEIKLLARLLRAEAEGEGKLGMLMVGNVAINRVRAKCYEFKNVNSITKMIYQRPGGFESVYYSYFFQAPRNNEIALAKRVINGERFSPATRSLWFYSTYTPGCKAKWYNQWNSGKFKNHCFYAPLAIAKCY